MNKNHSVMFLCSLSIFVLLYYLALIVTIVICFEINFIFSSCLWIVQLTWIPVQIGKVELSIFTSGEIAILSECHFDFNWLGLLGRVFFLSTC